MDHYSINVLFPGDHRSLAERQLRQQSPQHPSPPSIRGSELNNLLLLHGHSDAERNCAWQRKPWNEQIQGLSYVLLNHTSVKMVDWKAR